MGKCHELALNVSLETLHYCSFVKRVDWSVLLSSLVVNGRPLLQMSISVKVSTGISHK